MACFVDTNILCRLADETSPHHAAARQSVTRLLGRGEMLCFSPQIIIEFWAVATRPSNVNGLGWSVAKASEHVAKLFGQFEMLAETDVFSLWWSLVNEAGVSGKRSHDARVVAVMQRHNIAQILTFNVDDFAGFKSVSVLHPDQVITTT